MGVVCDTEEATEAWCCLKQHKPWPTQKQQQINHEVPLPNSPRSAINLYTCLEALAPLRFLQLSSALTVRWIARSVGSWVLLGLLCLLRVTLSVQTGSVRFHTASNRQLPRPVWCVIRTVKRCVIPYGKSLGGPALQRVQYRWQQL